MRKCVWARHLICKGNASAAGDERFFQGYGPKPALENGLGFGGAFFNRVALKPSVSDAFPFLPLPGLSGSGYAKANAIACWPESGETLINLWEAVHQAAAEAGGRRRRKVAPCRPG